MNNSQQPEFLTTFETIVSDAKIYFKNIGDYVRQKLDGSKERYESEEIGAYFRGYVLWKYLPDEIKKQARGIVDRLISFSNSLAQIVSVSALTGPEDLDDIRLATKSMRSALYLRRYYYDGPSAIHDEGTVLGFQPASQSERSGEISLNEVVDEFLRKRLLISSVLKLVSTNNSKILSEQSLLKVQSLKYRTGTAFIMMWMDQNHPELNDVADTVRSVFKSFDIRAVRADDIEHEGLITERILNEIKTSEFLFADLTGVRPNVYYEVGYAHALGKRVILFRKSGTGIEFDLAGYNCPEYDNLRDLRKKLHKRLINLTNKNPTESDE